MAPMTRSFSPGGVPTSDVADYYARRAQGEIGLILSEGTVVNRPASSSDPDIPRFHGEKPLLGWKGVIDKVHAAGGVMAPQLWHMGVVIPNASGWLPPGPFEGPSGLVEPGKTGGVAMSEADIAETIRAFAQAAWDAKALGFNAVELHGAHGYLIDQYFLASHQSAHGRVWRQMFDREKPVCQRVDPRRPQGCGPGLHDHSTDLAMETSGLHRQVGDHASGNGGVAAALGGCGRRYFPLLTAQVLGARVRRLGFELCRMGQENGRQSDHHGGICRSFRGFPGCL